MPMRTFDFSERLAEQIPESTQDGNNNGVSREEFNDLKNMFGELKTMIEDILK